MASIYPRGKTWWIAYRLNGKTIYESLKTRDPAKAEKMKGALELRLERGEVVEAKRVDLERFLTEGYKDRYIEAGGSELAESRAVSWRKDFGAIAAFLRFAKLRAHSRLDKVTVEVAEDFRAWRSSESVTDSTVNHDLRVLRAAWNVAKRLGNVRENPFAVVRPLKIPQRSIRFPRADAIGETIATAKKLGSRLYGLVAVCVYAGLRAAEAASLRWEDVNLSEGFIAVRNREDFVTKSRKNRMVPINQELAPILRGLRPATGEGLCFPNEAGAPYPDGDLQKRVKTLSKAVGIDFKLHDLRKSFATHLRTQGVPIDYISGLLGHCSPVVTASWYAGFTPETPENYVDRLSFKAKAGDPLTESAGGAVKKVSKGKGRVRPVKRGQAMPSDDGEIASREAVTTEYGTSS